MIEKYLFSTLARSFNINDFYNFFNYKIAFKNSQQAHSNLKGYSVWNLVLNAGVRDF